MLDKGLPESSKKKFYKPRCHCIFRHIQIRWCPDIHETTKQPTQGVFILKVFILG